MKIVGGCFISQLHQCQATLQGNKKSASKYRRISKYLKLPQGVQSCERTSSSVKLNQPLMNGPAMASTASFVKGSSNASVTAASDFDARP